MEGSMESSRVSFHLSRTLMRHLKDKASQEGITPDELVIELVSEGLVLRAWEIMERKSTMKGQSSGGQYRYDASRSGGRPSGYRQHHHADAMEDRSQFLDYVRHQEKHSNRSFRKENHDPRPNFR